MLHSVAIKATTTNHAVNHDTEPATNIMPIVSMLDMYTFVYNDFTHCTCYAHLGHWTLTPSAHDQRHSIWQFVHQLLLQCLDCC